jgi:hypothetical protein
MNTQEEDWTFSRVLTHMDEQDSTGILEIGVPSTGTTTHIHMRRGYVVDVEEVVGDRPTQGRGGREGGRAQEHLDL